MWRAREPYQQIARLVREPASDNRTGTQIDEVPVVDEAEPSHVETEDTAAADVVTLELVNQDEERRKPLLMKPGLKEPVSFGQWQITEPPGHCPLCRDGDPEE